MENGLAYTSSKLPIFTLADGIKLINAAEGKEKYSPEMVKMVEAIKGNYLHTDETAKQKAEWLKTGNKTHGKDSPKGVDSTTGLPGGKLPGHPTFSTQTPYHIPGLAITAAGEWSKLRDNPETGKEEWAYIPDSRQFNNPDYMKQLMDYYRDEKGRGIDGIWMPNGGFIR